MVVLQSIICSCMSKKRRTAPVKPNKELSLLFHEFILNHPPSRVSVHLRSILLDYIGSQLRTGFPVDFDIWIWELSDLFDLLDRAAGQEKTSKL